MYSKSYQRYFLLKTIFLLCLTSVYFAIGVSADVVARKWEIQNITVACLDLGPDAANCYVISSHDQDAYVVDPGGNPARIIEYLKTEKLNIMGYLETHGHNDHIRGLVQMVQTMPASAGIHPLDVPLYNRRMGNDGPFDLFFEDGQNYGTNDLEFKVIHTPGHSPGGVCFYFERAGILFTGDTLFKSGVGRTDLDGGNSSQLRLSLKKLKKLPSETEVFPGHDDKTVLGRERALTK